MATGKAATEKGLLRVWKLTRAMFAGDLLRRQSRPFTIALAGRRDRCRYAVESLRLPTNLVACYDTVHEARSRSEHLILAVDASDLLLSAAQMLLSNRDLRIAVAAQCEGLRPVVVEQIIGEWARVNAKRAALDSLPGVFPALDFLIPFTGAGDMVILTRNQLSMVLEIAACHNLPPDPRVRITELVPVIGSAFGWRAAARELLAFAPFGTGVAISAAVAYAGTSAVGRAVDYYYRSGGKRLDIRKTAREIIAGSVLRIGAVLANRGRHIEEEIGTAGA